MHYMDASVNFLFWWGNFDPRFRTEGRTARRPSINEFDFSPFRLLSVRFVRSLREAEKGKGGQSRVALI
jgi:hypothetical protein